MTLDQVYESPTGVHDWFGKIVTCLKLVHNAELAQGEMSLLCMEEYKWAGDYCRLCKGRGVVGVHSFWLQGWKMGTG